MAQPARPFGAAAVSRFAPWKSRIKSVLEKTNDRFIDERDLGLAILPGRRFILGTFQSVICALPPFAPLRC